MAHTLLFGGHISLVIGIGFHFEGNDFGDTDTIPFEADTFYGVIGHKLHITDAESMEDIGSDAIIAFISLMSEVKVSIDSIEAIFLELISGDFIHQADTSALLIEVNDRSASLLFDTLHGEMELFATLTSHRAEDIPGHARRVNSHQYGVIACDLTLDQGDMFEAIVLLEERDKVEMSVSGGHIDLLATYHEGLGVKAIGDKVTDADKFESPLIGASAEFGESRHRTVIAHNLHEGSSGEKAGESCEVDSGFSVAGTLEDASILGLKGVDMTGAAECSGGGIGVGKSADSSGAILD